MDSILRHWGRLKCILLVPNIRPRFCCCSSPFDTEAHFLDLDLSITNGIVSSRMYDKRDYFNFEIVYFPYLDGYFPRFPSYGLYISQLIRFARVCSNVSDFNNRNQILTVKLIKHCYIYFYIR